MRIKNKLSAFLLSVLLCLLFLLLDQKLLVTEHYEIAVRELPKGYEGLRIVLLSDLHGASFGTDNGRLVERVGREKPDLIALTGDFVCETGDAAAFASLLRQLRELAPCYYVSGNHEWAAHAMEKTAEILEENDTVYLNNRYVILEKNGERLCLCGAEDPNSYAEMISPEELVSDLRSREGTLPVVFLCHRNNSMEKTPSLDVDLILCGHSHGGIVRLPGAGGVLGVDRKLFPRYDAGLYSNDRYAMVVSRGLGTIHHIPRICNFPEIAVVELKKEA